MKKNLILACFLTSLVYADVVNEYRDYSKDGYIATTYLYDSTAEAKQRAIETYGEYDLTEFMILTGRLTRGYFFNKEESDRKNIHIASSGLRFHWLLDEKLRIGFKTNFVHRNYNEVKGWSYRFMPVVEYDPFKFVNLRYIFEYDYIPSSSFKEETKSQTHKETALYFRLMPWKFFDQNNGLEYELKMASGIGNDRETGKSLWRVSYEHNAYWKINKNFKLKYSRVKEGDTWGYKTIGLVYNYTF